MAAMTPHEVLEKYWGYKSFRSKQLEIIESVLEGKDTLALLPTGGGKSICFQIPAMMLDGVCIVVSPLIALMKDQVHNLKEKGINASAVYSGMSHREIDRILDNAVYGHTKLLYVSPERLKTPMFRERLKRMKVGLIAVDEAHCISQWGYDFRPSYLHISELKSLIVPQPPVIALTATATSRVAEDIQKKLRFASSNLISKSFERKNLSYQVRFTEDKRNVLLDYLKNNKGSGIVYLRSRMLTRETAWLLQKNGISADYYHAGLSTEERNRKQEEWINNKIRVICSTNAFGMGIDKPDVRFVFHLDLPDSPESYFQEAGRAGRDEQYSEAISLIHASDILNLRKRVEQTFPAPDLVRKVYQTICNMLQLAIGGGLDESFVIDLHELAERTKLKPIALYSSLKILELNEYITFSESVWSPSRIQVIPAHESLLAFIDSNNKWKDLMHLLLRSYSRITEEPTRINEEMIAKKLDIHRAEVIKQLNRLQELEIIDYQARRQNPQITFTTERLNAETLYLSADTYTNRKERAVEKMEAMIGFAETKNGCRSNLLLAYFDELKETPCGVCDLCASRFQIQDNDTFDESCAKIKSLLQIEPIPMKDLLIRAGGLKRKDKITKVVQWLLDNEQLVQTESNHLCVNG